MKCWAWEYFRTSVANSAIFFRREPDLFASPARAGVSVARRAPAVERLMAETNSRRVQQELTFTSAPIEQHLRVEGNRAARCARCVDNPHDPRRRSPMFPGQ